MNSFLYCLYQIKELENILNQHYPSDVDKEKIELFINFYKNFENESHSMNKIKQYFLKSIRINNFQYIIKEIFKRINEDIFKEKQKDLDNDQVNKYDEDKAKQKFIEEQKNSSIFKKKCFIFQKK